MRLIHGRTWDIETLTPILTPDDGLGGGKVCRFELPRKPPFSGQTTILYSPRTIKRRLHRQPSTRSTDSRIFQALG